MLAARKLSVCFLALVYFFPCFSLLLELSIAIPLSIADIQGAADNALSSETKPPTNINEINATHNGFHLLV